MKTDKPRTAEDIFKDMHRELRAWNSEIPESPDRMDPILRIMLQLYAGQLASIDNKIKYTWKSASNALIKSLCPESMRWPVPAFTVMRAEPSDPVIHVDPQTRFFYKEERDEGETFFFSSLRTEKLLKADVKKIYYAVDGKLHDISPLPPDSTQVSSRVQPSSFSGRNAAIYVAVEHDGPADDFAGSIIFLQGKEEALKQLVWARWLPCIDGGFYDDGGFSPGAGGTIDRIFSEGDETIDWGGLRRSSDLFKTLENRMGLVPESFTTPWRPGSPGDELQAKMRAAGLSPDEEPEKLFWIKIALPEGGDRSAFQSSFGVFFNCFIAVNKHERSLFKHTGGNRLIEIELPEKIEDVLEIISVFDSNGKSYVPQHEVLDAEKESGFYTQIEQDGKLSLWFDFSAEIELPPDSITVNYSITSGTEANGVSAGKITELYENHPGIESIKNITPVSGAIPAKSEDQVVKEVSARLRGRDRALTFEQIVNWIKTFDGRIIGAECEKGVMRAENGVRKCIAAKVFIDGKEFYSDEEIELLKARLGSFLKARTSVNSQFSLEIVKES